LRAAGPDSYLAFVLIAIGLLIKAGAIGVHVWLPGAYAEADNDFSAMLSAVVSKVAMFGLLVGGYVAVRSTVSLELAHVLGWIGMLTTVAGALMALKQDDIKKMLAYSSMSQIGYIVTAVALMSHLGWVTALYLVANHMSVKAILFLAAAALILRTGTRNLNDYGGLARKLPFTFAAVVVAMIAMSGLPPLTGFGGKWLLLTGMMERGWYWPVIFGLVATFVGFLYMARFVYVIFLRARPAQSESITEAPLALLVPQYLAIAAILAVSFMPKLFIKPLSAAIDPYFASTLRWDGMSLEMIYGTWNPVPTMLIAIAISALLLLILWIIQRRFQNVARRKKAGLDAFRKVALDRLTPPIARGFWRRVATATLAAAGSVRLVYTGNGQTYALYVLYYFLALYVASGGAQQFWTSNGRRAVSAPRTPFRSRNGPAGCGCLR
jgi:formate hydrogenlyase subunit 3/multisubunit Na+/H+ antiporter MnhD subunit